MTPAPPPSLPIRTEWETPSVVRQVEGHLILGPLVRRNITLVTPAIVGFLFIIVVLLILREPRELFTPITGLIAACGAKRTSALTQATILWYSLKDTRLLAGFIISTVGTLSTWKWHGTPTDAGVVLIAGLAIIPGLEFIPRLIPHQKWITLGRIVILLGCLYYALPELLAD